MGEVVARNSDFVSIFDAEYHDTFKGLYQAFNLATRMEEVPKFSRSPAMYYVVHEKLGNGASIRSTGRCDMHELEVDGETVGYAGYAPELNKCFYWTIEERR